MRKLPILLCVFALAACTGKPPEPQVQPADVATPFDALKAQKQRAQDVRQAVEKQGEEQRKQIEAQQ